MRLEIDAAVFDVARVDMEVEAVLPGVAAPVRRTNLRFDKNTLSQTLSMVVPDDQAATFQGIETFRRVGEVDSSDRSRRSKVSSTAS